MPDPRTVTLRGQAVTITDAMRTAIAEEMPELLWIGEATLRANAIDAWAAAVATSPFARIGDMKPSGNFDTPPLASGTQADHLRSVCRMSVATADEFEKLFPGFRVDRDILIAGALCHDIGKVWEFDPGNVARWTENPRKVGRPSIRHPAYGVYICLTMGLPEGVAHIAAAHSGEGELLTRSLENTIVHWADVTFWKVAEAGNLFAAMDSWLGKR